MQVGAQHWRRHHALARLHPVVVAFDRVDFTVVRHIAVGVGQRPLGKGVGGKALVHETERRDTTLVFQVTEIRAHLIRQQQAFVDHGAAGHAGNVVFLAVFQMQVLDRRAGRLADHVQLALQRVLHDHIVAATDKDLAHHRLLGAYGRRHRHVAVHRYVAPAQQDLPLGLDGALHLLFAGQA